MADRRGYNVCSRRSITIHRDPGELYSAWHDPGRLICFLSGAKGVDILDNRRSIWNVDVPGIGPECWEAEITDDKTDGAISWQTIGDTGFEHEGSVRFDPAPNDLGTEVKMEIRSRFPGGPFGNAIAKLIGRSPEDYISKTLHNFKQLMETGEVATGKGPSGREGIPENEETAGGES
ncbi:MAG TPA: SRPBCC family protein [Deltaproteobacteria bacterium]|jgi:uncharacterized membrane protein|nr:SRPBCC family protein [Deltaproteobacteria bacterium]HQI01351.1 SRPBCC family protein [Deltaproteobacteria bacterium]HQJ09900.1 SRPBCC family protein [Deltaproteobacteria bacterium]